MSEIESAESHAYMVRALTDNDEALELIRERDAAVRAQALRDAAEKIEPKQTRPCDCEGCYCVNVGSAQAVASWDADEYSAAAIRAMIEEPHA